MTGTPIRSEKDSNENNSSEESPTLPENQSDPSTGAIEEVTETEADRLKRYTGLLEATLREQNQTIQRLNESAATPKPAPAPAPTRDAVADRQEFFNDPVEITRRTVRDELQETVKPLLDFVKEMKGQGAIGRFKEIVKNDARFAPAWDAAVERAVDESLARVAPDQINENVVRAAAVQAIGLKSMGLLEGSSPPAPPAPTGDRRVIQPAHMRPSAPPAPSANGQKQKLRSLTENEERLRRENHQTHEDYLFWLDVPAGEVTTAIPPSKRGK